MRFLIFIFIIAFSTPVQAIANCYSDYDCDFGYACVKPLYSTEGICMKVVDDYGLDKFYTPKPESIYPRRDEGCRSMFDCPIGFSCDLEYKVCVRL